MTASDTLYLDLLKGCLSRSLFPEGQRPLEMSYSARRYSAVWALLSVVQKFLSRAGLQLNLAYDQNARAAGADWPVDAETMIGTARLNQLEHCVVDVLKNDVPGDFIETGVWRGGACIFMRAILKAAGDRTRRVWVADSFEGLPKPDGRYAQDEADQHWKYSDVLGVSLEQVQANFARYGLLDDQVVFLKGWFKDTLSAAPIHELSILRLDGDMYSSTRDAIGALYGKVSLGGYIIVDDYHSVPACRRAIDDFRIERNIQEPIREIDGSGVYWQKSAAA